MGKTKPNKFKLTPEAYKNILRICEKLGKFQKVDKHGNRLFRAASRSVMGSDLKVTHVNGKPVNKLKRYVEHFKEPVLVNHAVELVEIYQKDGDVGVDIYVKHFEKILKEEKDSKQAEKTSEQPPIIEAPNQ